MELTADFVEKQYNNRALVPDHQRYFDRWERDSEFVRATLPCRTDLAYGPDKRHRLDAFTVPNSRGTLIFIHGGYWRSLDKSMFAWLAAAWAAARINVVLPNYRLCPTVRIPQIVDDIVAATNWVFANGTKLGLNLDRVAVSGHSAGGHLTAALFAAPREALAFDPARIVGGVPISGVFDFAPLPLFSFNTDLRIEAADVPRLSLLDKVPTITAPMVVAAGAAESAEFQRQSRDFAAAWKAQVRSLLLLPSLNHFSVVDAFAERGQPLYESSLALFP